MDVTARALVCFVLPPVVLDALCFDHSFAASLARFGTALTGSMHIGVGAYWHLASRSEALDAMVESCDSVFLQVLEGVRCLDQSPCIPAAIGMPGAGQSRLVMVEFVAIVEELARRYYTSGQLASPVVASVLITFSSGIGVDPADSPCLDETLAWHALHAFFGYCSTGQQYKLFLDTFRIAGPGRRRIVPSRCANCNMKRGSCLSACLCAVPSPEHAIPGM